MVIRFDGHFLSFGNTTPREEVFHATPDLAHDNQCSGSVLVTRNIHLLFNSKFVSPFYFHVIQRWNRVRGAGRKLELNKVQIFGFVMVIQFNLIIALINISIC